MVAGQSGKSMMANCFQTCDELRLTACDYESAVEATRNPEVNTRVDVQGSQTNELIEVLDQFEVQDLARWLCLEARDRPGFYPPKTLIFMVIPLQPALGDFHEPVPDVRKGLLLVYVRNGEIAGRRRLLSYSERRYSGY
jgi:hypothetical protein